MTILDYFIVEEDSPGKLEKSVMDKIKEGWLVQGGVGAFPIAGALGRYVYYQAMVLPERIKDVAKEIGIDWDSIEDDKA